MCTDLHGKAHKQELHVDRPQSLLYVGPLQTDIHAPFQAPFEGTEAVAAPPRCSWVPDHTNKVVLTLIYVVYKLMPAMLPRQETASMPASMAGILQADMQTSRVHRCGKGAWRMMLGVLRSLQVRLIGLVGAGPEVRKVGDQTVAQVSLGIRPKTGNTNEISWVVCDFWNYEVGTYTRLQSICSFLSISRTQLHVQDVM